MNKKGLSILEILVAALILTIITAGLVGVFMSSRRMVLRWRARATASELGKVFLDPMQQNIRQDTWGTTCGSGGSCAAIPPQIIGGKTYTPNYTVSPVLPGPGVGAGTNLQRVEVRIDWANPELQ